MRYLLLSLVIFFSCITHAENYYLVGQNNLGSLYLDKDTGTYKLSLSNDGTSDLTFIEREGNVYISMPDGAKVTVYGKDRIEVYSAINDRVNQYVFSEINENSYFDFDLSQADALAILGASSFFSQSYDLPDPCQGTIDGPGNTKGDGGFGTGDCSVIAGNGSIFSSPSKSALDQLIKDDSTVGTYSVEGNCTYEKQMFSRPWGGFYTYSDCTRDVTLSFMISALGTAFGIFRKEWPLIAAGYSGMIYSNGQIAERKSFCVTSFQERKASLDDCMVRLEKENEKDDDDDIGDQVGGDNPVEGGGDAGYQTFPEYQLMMHYQSFGICSRIVYTSVGIDGHGSTTVPFVFYYVCF